MDTNATTTVTITLAPAAPVAAPSFTGSHILLDHNWLLTVGGRQYGIWQARGLNGCTLVIADQTAWIPTTAPGLVATTTCTLLAVGVLLVIGTKLLKPARKQI